MARATIDSVGPRERRVQDDLALIAPAGRTYEIQCCVVFHLKDGRIDRVHEYFDMDTVKRLTRSAATAGRQQP